MGDTSRPTTKEANKAAPPGLGQDPARSGGPVDACALTLLSRVGLRHVLRPRGAGLIPGSVSSPKHHLSSQTGTKLASPSLLPPTQLKSSDTPSPLTSSPCSRRALRGTHVSLGPHLSNYTQTPRARAWGPCKCSRNVQLNYRGVRTCLVPVK